MINHTLTQPVSRAAYAQKPGAPEDKSTVDV